MHRLLVREIAERKARQHVVDARGVDLAPEPVAYFLRRADDRNAGIDGGGEILGNRIICQRIAMHAP